MTILPILFTFLSVAPNGYTYRDAISFNLRTSPNASYNVSVDTNYYCDNYVTYNGYLDYSDNENYRVVSDNITFNSIIYTDDSNLWEYVGTMQLVIPLNNVNDLEFYLSRLKFSTYFDDDYFIIKADLYDANDDYWNPIDSTGWNLTYSMSNDNLVETRFNIENLSVQLLDRVNSRSNNNYDSIYQTGYNEGYTNGFNEGFNADSTALTIFSGILNVALVPINFFLGIFNFEILGINISSFVSAILSVCLVIIVIRFITGKKQGD